MPGLRLTVAEQTYEIGPMTLGEHRAAKRLFGVTDIGEMRDGDPDAVAAFIFTAMKRANPEQDNATLVDRIDSLNLETVSLEVIEDEEAEGEPDPTQPADAAQAGASASKPKPARGKKASAA